MATSRRRQPGSDRGRPAVDWEVAFAYYASLPDPDRCYQAVAENFSVSVRTVERRGRDDGWKERLRDVQAEAAAAADRELARGRAETFANIEKLIDASLTTYAQQLRAGSVRVAPSICNACSSCAKNCRDQEAAATTASRAATQEEPDVDPEARKLEVVRALHEAGAFDRLQALVHRPNPEGGNDEP